MSMELQPIAFRTVKEGKKKKNCTAKTESINLNDLRDFILCESLHLTFHILNTDLMVSALNRVSYKHKMQLYYSE